MNTVGLFMYKNESKQRIIIIDGAIGGDFHFFSGKAYASPDIYLFFS
jgi:hypothetical protein